MRPGPEQIAGLARHQMRRPTVKCAQDADRFAAIGIFGDDGDEFLTACAEAFGVGLDGFSRYFHHNGNEMPGSAPRWPVSEDGRAIGPIPLTPQLLAKAATDWRLTLEYPAHRVKGSRTAAIPVYAALVTLVLIALTALGVFPA